MKALTLKRQAGRSFWILVPALAAALFLAGCSGDSEKSASSSSPQKRGPQTQQRQGQPGQRPKPGSRQLLSSSDVSDEQVQKVARIAMSTRMATRQDRMKLRKDMRKKYGNPQQMDSTQKAKARKEIRRRQMKMRKKQMKIMQQEAKKEGMSPQMFRKIMRSAQQDSTLQKRLQTAMKAQMRKRMKERMNEMKQNPGPQNR